MLKLLLLGYLPGLLLPLLMALFPGNIAAVWFFMAAWVVYVFLLLVYAYYSEKGGDEIS